MTKKIRADNMQTRVDAGRMYGTRVKGCPVASYEKYIEKLNPKYTALFQRQVKEIPTDDTVPWYVNAPLGEHMLGTFMARLSEDAGLSKRYTNHSIRSTWIKRG